MHRRMRHVDFIWPVPSADLDAIEVLEAVGVSDDRAVWRPRPRLVEPRRIEDVLFKEMLVQ